MKRLLGFLLVLGLSVLSTGCGDGLLKTQGRLLKGGQPLIPGEGEVIEITFVPIPPDGKPPADYYFADTDQSNGTFRPSGKNGRGMPPGKYRVAIEIMKKKKDILKGKFDAERSPYTFDVTAATAELVIDLDRP